MPLLLMLTPCGRPIALPSAVPVAAVDPANCVSPEKFRLSDKFAAPEMVAVNADPGSAPLTMLPLVSKPTGSGIVGQSGGASVQRRGPLPVFGGWSGAGPGVLEVVSQNMRVAEAVIYLHAHRRAVGRGIRRIDRTRNNRAGGIQISADRILG